MRPPAIRPWLRCPPRATASRLFVTTQYDFRAMRAAAQAAFDTPPPGAAPPAREVIDGGPAAGDGRCGFIRHARSLRSPADCSSPPRRRLQDGWMMLRRAPRGGKRHFGRHWPMPQEGAIACHVISYAAKPQARAAPIICATGGAQVPFLGHISGRACQPRYIADEQERRRASAMRAA